MSFPYTLATFVIPNGAAVSNSIFIADGEPVGIVMDPIGWTAAAITFLASADGVNFYPIYDGDGVLVQIGLTALPTAASYIAIGDEPHISFAHFRGVQYLQLQSSTVGTVTPVNQGAARTLTGIIRKSLTGTF
jgi:hypothetical protein